MPSVVHEPSGLESFEGASSPSPLESLGGSRVLAACRCCVGAVAVRRAQYHTEQEKIFTGVVDTWRVGINQQYLYSSGEYLIFPWLFQKKKVACRGILTAQDSTPLESLGGSSRLVNNTISAASSRPRIKILISGIARNAILASSSRSWHRSSIAGHQQCNLPASSHGIRAQFDGTEDAEPGQRNGGMNSRICEALGRQLVGDRHITR